MTHFIHLRYTTPVETPFGTQHEIAARGGLTIAYKVDEENPEVHIGFAKCSRKDLFNKKRGRVISEGRLSSENHRNTIKFEVEDFNRITNDRVELHRYVLGAMVNILPEGSVNDYVELISS
jgi:hypothetical protein